MITDLEKRIFGNGAGSIKTLEHVKKACRGAMTRITVGSITASERAGNSGDVYYFHPQEFWSLNSLGLPNRGMPAYRSLLPEMVAIAHGAGKELWASISPFSPEECAHMTAECLECDVDGVEVNGSCPNVWEGGKRKAIPALDPEAAEEMFAAVARKIGTMDKVSFKLSPTRDPGLLLSLARVIDQYGIPLLVCCNTKPDQYDTRVDGKPALAFRSSEGEEMRHTGGLAGSRVLDDNAWVARVMRSYSSAAIIGVGGVFTGADAERYLLNCIGIQSTTGYLEFGEQLFVDMLIYLSMGT
jgi:dihydroorotate dehydrogenase